MKTYLLKHFKQKFKNAYLPKSLSGKRYLLVLLRGISGCTVLLDSVYRYWESRKRIYNDQQTFTGRNCTKG